MSEHRMDRWQQRWDEGKTGWHKSELNFALKNHGERLLPRKSRVLLPLCGKTLDLKWCYDEGHEVVGVEGVERPVQEFFTEHALPHTVHELPWAKLYQSDDGRMKLYCCDLFDVDAAALGQFDAVFDRGSLVAINEEDRDKYAELMKKLLAPEFRYLMALTQYTPTESFSGPPRNVPLELVQRLYGEQYRLEVLETIDRTEEDAKVKAVWGLDAMHEMVALMTRK